MEHWIHRTIDVQPHPAEDPALSAGGGAVHPDQPSRGGEPPGAPGARASAYVCSCIDGESRARRPLERPRRRGGLRPRLSVTRSPPSSDARLLIVLAPWPGNGHPGAWDRAPRAPRCAAEPQGPARVRGPRPSPGVRQVLNCLGREEPRLGGRGRRAGRVEQVLDAGDALDLARLGARRSVQARRRCRAGRRRRPARRSRRRPWARRAPRKISLRTRSASVWSSISSCRCGMTLCTMPFAGPTRRRALLRLK